MLKEQFLRMSKTRKRIFAAAMATALISTSVNLGSLAVEGASSKNGSVITAFEELPEEIAYQYLPIGSQELDIEFPDELNVTIYNDRADEDSDDEEESEEERESEGEKESEEEGSEEGSEPGESGDEDRDEDRDSDEGEDDADRNSDSDDGSDRSDSGDSGSGDNGSGDEGSGDEGSGGSGSGDEGSDGSDSGDNGSDRGSGEDQGSDSGSPDNGSDTGSDTGNDSGNDSNNEGSNDNSDSGSDETGSGSDGGSNEGASDTGSDNGGSNDSSSEGSTEGASDGGDAGVDNNSGTEDEGASGSEGEPVASLLPFSDDDIFDTVADAVKRSFTPVTVYASEGELRELSAGDEETLKGVIWKLNKDESEYNRFQAVRAGDVFVYEPLIKAFGLKSDVPLPQIRVTITEEDGSYIEKEESSTEAPEEVEETVSENEEDESLSQNETSSDDTLSENEASDEETLSENEAEESVSDNSVSENEVSENEVPEAFDQMMVVGGVRVRVAAPEGVFPKGSVMQVSRLSDSDEEKVQGVIGNGSTDEDAGDSESGVETMSFDITIYDEAGNEIQPDLSFGTPRITFENVKLVEDYVDEKNASDDSGDGSDGNDKFSVYHLDTDLTGAERLASDINEGEKSVAVDGEHFSIYTIVRDSSDSYSDTLGGDYGGFHIEASGAKFKVETSSYLVNVIVNKVTSSAKATIKVSMKNEGGSTLDRLKISGSSGSEVIDLQLNKVKINYSHSSDSALELDQITSASVTFNGTTLNSQSGTMNIDCDTDFVIGEGTSEIIGAASAEGKPCIYVTANSNLVIKKSGDGSGTLKINTRKTSGNKPVITGESSSSKMTIKSGNVSFNEYFTHINTQIDGGFLSIPDASRQFEDNSSYILKINGGTHVINKKLLTDNPSDAYYLNYQIRITGGSINFTNDSLGLIKYDTSGVSDDPYFAVRIVDFGSKYANKKISELYVESQGACPWNPAFPSYKTKASKQALFDYGLDDCYTDSEGKAYFWFPFGSNDYSDQTKNHNNLFSVTLDGIGRFVSSDSSSIVLVPYCAKDSCEGRAVNEVVLYDKYVKDIELDVTNLMTGSGSPNLVKTRTTLVGSDGQKYKGNNSDGKYRNIFQDITWSFDGNYGDDFYFADRNGVKIPESTTEAIAKVNREGLQFVITKPGIYEVKATLKDGISCNIEKTFTINNTLPVDDIICRLGGVKKDKQINLVMGFEYDVRFNQYDPSGVTTANKLDFDVSPSSAVPNLITLTVYRYDGKTVISDKDTEPEAIIVNPGGEGYVDRITFRSAGKYKIAAKVAKGKSDGSDLVKTYDVNVSSDNSHYLNITATDFKYNGETIYNNRAKINVDSSNGLDRDNAQFRIICVNDKQEGGTYPVPEDAKAVNLKNEYLEKLEAETPLQLSQMNNRILSPGAYLIWCENLLIGSMVAHTTFVVNESPFKLTFKDTKNTYSEIKYSGSKLKDNKSGITVTFDGNDVTADAKYSFMDISNQFTKQDDGSWTRSDMDKIRKGDFSSLDLGGFDPVQAWDYYNNTNEEAVVYAVKCEYKGLVQYGVFQVKDSMLKMTTNDIEYSDNTKFWTVYKKWLNTNIILDGGGRIPASNITSQLFDIVKLDNSYVKTGDDGSLSLSDDVRKGNLYAYNKTHADDLFANGAATLKPDADSAKLEMGAWMVRCKYGNSVGYSAFIVKKKDINNSGAKFTAWKSAYDGKGHPAVALDFLPNDLTEKDFVYTLDGTDHKGSIPPVKDVGTYTLKITVKNDKYQGSVDVTPGPEITARSLDRTDISIANIPDQWYTGQAHEPALIITDYGFVNDQGNNQVIIDNPDRNLNSNYKLMLGTDYNVTYKDNVNIGTATVIITGIGNYTGTTKDPVTFKIKQYTGVIVPLYDEKETIASWYNGKVTISAKDYLVADSAAGPFKESYELTGDSKGVYKDLFFKYVGDNDKDKEKDYYGAILSKKLGPFNFSTSTPTGKIKVLSKTWKELQSKDKVYGYTNDKKKISVTITADENSSQAGLDTVQYFITNKAYTAENALIKAAEGKWEKYNDKSKPGLSENALNYSYAKITDNAGKSTYISTQGVWYDTKKPEVSSTKATPTDKDVEIKIKGEDKESGIQNYYAMVLKKGEGKPGKDDVKSKGKKAEDGAVTIGGLTPKTIYMVYAVIEDKAGNLSDVKDVKFTSKEEKKEDSKSGSSSKSGSTSGGAGSGKGGSGKTALGDSNSRKRGVGASGNAVSDNSSDDAVIKNKVPYIDDASEGILIGKEKTSGWTKINDETGSAEEPAEVYVDMNGATVVPSYVLNTIKDKNITYYFEMGSDVIWVVNGLSFEDSVKDDIDFRVKTDTKNIPSKLINEIADVYPHKNLSLSHEGDFGFDAIMTLNMGGENGGMYANLYYYNEDEGSLEFMESSGVDGNGNTQFEFKHASDYTVILRGDALTEKTAQALKNSGGSEELEVSETAAPKTNKHWWLLLLTIICLLLCGFILFMPEQKKQA